MASSPFAARADGARSKATRERARQIYGSRIYRLQKADVSKILDEQNVFDIFLDGAYGGLADEGSKATLKELKALKKGLLEACIKGDGASASGTIGKFVRLASITEQ